MHGSFTRKEKQVTPPPAFLLLFVVSDDFYLSLIQLINCDGKRLSSFRMINQRLILSCHQLSGSLCSCKHDGVTALNHRLLARLHFLVYYLHQV